MLLVFLGVCRGCGCFVEYWGLELLVFGLCIVEFMGGAWLFGWMRGCWSLIICYIHVFC